MQNPDVKTCFVHLRTASFPPKKNTSRGILTEGRPELASNSPLVIKRGNQKSPLNGGFNGKKIGVSHCNV
jgi:hypothetical protein